MPKVEKVPDFGQNFFICYDCKKSFVIQIGNGVTEGETHYYLCNSCFDGRKNTVDLLDDKRMTEADLPFKLDDITMTEAIPDSKEEKMHFYIHTPGRCDRVTLKQWDFIIKEIMPKEKKETG